MTETGKSTLMEVMYSEYKKMYPDVLTLIVDTKPRFRAHKESNGLSTHSSGRYKRWGISGSEIIPESYVLPLVDNPISVIRQLMRTGAKTFITQAESKNEWGYVSEAVRHFYEDLSASIPRLVVVDELADFFEHRIQSDIFQRISRNGRERDVALMAGSQRPRKVPVEIMTEFTRLYMFSLQYWEDLKHILQFGIPPETRAPDGHVFYFYDRKLKEQAPSNNYYELDLHVNYFTGKPYERRTA